MRNSIEIRPIQKKDNEAVSKMIRDVLIEQKAPKTGTAYEDKALDDLYGTYRDDRAIYFVLLENNKIIGSVGIQAIAKIQKFVNSKKCIFYLKPEEEV